MTTRHEGETLPMTLLLHGYRYGEKSATANWPMAPRNTAQLVATRYLHGIGALNSVVVVADWDQQGKPFAERFEGALIEEGIPAQKIVITGIHAQTTAKEVEIFLGLQKGGKKRASIATEAHMPRVERSYRRRGVGKPDLIVAEDVLRAQVSLEEKPDLRAQALLEHFSVRKNTRKFDRKEIALRRIPEWLLEFMAGNSAITKLQAKRDG